MSLNALEPSKYADAFPELNEAEALAGFKVDGHWAGIVEWKQIGDTMVPVPHTENVNIHELFRQMPGIDPEGIHNGAKRFRAAEVRAYLDRMPEAERAALMYKWKFFSRHNQMAPEGDWIFWLLLAGRGFGKTRTGAEWINERVQSGKAKRIALVAPTAADVRKTMVEGESGILAISPPWNRPLWEPSKLQLTWPNGAIAGLFSAEEPERLRGPQCDTFWADELAAWRKLQETWDMLQFGFRLGDDPRGCITTTPKPLKVVKELVKDEIKPMPGSNSGQTIGSVVMTRGNTLENVANLAPQFYKTVVKKYENTRMGRQELNAEILEDLPGALWLRSNIDAARIPNPHGPFTTVYQPADDPMAEKVLVNQDILRAHAKRIIGCIPEDLSRITVNVDPNVSNNEGSDEIGITVTGKGLSGRGYVLADVSMRGSPGEWATTAIMAWDAFGGDRIVGEANQGGNMVEYTIKSTATFLKQQGYRTNDHVPVTLVHATRGKVTRAEPSANRYEQKSISHVGVLSVLEDQMCLFTQDFDKAVMGYSPDRVDSLVWGLTNLYDEGDTTGISEFYHQEHLKRLQLVTKIVDPGRIKMVAPVGINTFYGRLGDKYDIAEDRLAYVLEDDVAPARTAGFVEVEE